MKLFANVILITASLLSVSFTLLAKELPDYNKVSGVSGNLTSVGSDTLASMLSLWGQAFKTYYPNVNVQVQASGSSTASPALTEGTAQFGPMSRPMRLKELQSFEREHGYKPTELKVAIDAIGLFVHKDNPIQGLSFEQIDSIFSSTMRCGSNIPIESWSELGIKNDWAKRRIQLFGRNSVSGTYGYFKRAALCNGDFKRNVNELPGSSSVVQAVASGINTIGYSGVGYSVSGAKLLPISIDGKEYIQATRQTILSGQYPLSRFLYVYINKHPSKPLSLLETEFIRFIYSKQGQLAVEKDGYLSISSDLAKKELDKIGL
ncbi:PstS family phosphate ABC transporter substrate-binding protein [Vibrio sp. MA40-2]|uniref:PstS family phosphate ABC transporter substrate-binding protein n=1 Tax=Vibrio sp. MA40-2 TaxID=3391828 RepID=UPI0039A783CA